MHRWFSEENISRGAKKIWNIHTTNLNNNAWVEDEVWKINN